MVMQFPYPMGMQSMGAGPGQAQTAYSGMSQPMPNLQAGALEASTMGYGGGGQRPGGRFSAPPGWKDARMARIAERQRMKGDNQPMPNPTGGPMMPGGPMRPMAPMPTSPVGGRPMGGPLPTAPAMPGGNMPPPALGGGANLPAMGGMPQQPGGKPVGPLPKRPVGPMATTNQGGRY